jgi:hypothetical protein
MSWMAPACSHVVGSSRRTVREKPATASLPHWASSAVDVRMLLPSASVRTCVRSCVGTGLAAEASASPRPPKD